MEKEYGKRLSFAIMFLSIVMDCNLLFIIVIIGYIFPVTKDLYLLRNILLFYKCAFFPIDMLPNRPVKSIILLNNVIFYLL
jgi:hypothetical protein